MKNIIPKTWLLALLTAALGANALPAAELAGVKLDDSINVQGTTLALNGAGLRTKFGAKVYVIALYLAARSRDADTVINGTGPRRIKLVMKRNVAADTMWAALREGIEANSTV